MKRGIKAQVYMSAGLGDVFDLRKKQAEQIRLLSKILAEKRCWRDKLVIRCFWQEEMPIVLDLASST